MPRIADVCTTASDPAPDAKGSIAGFRLPARPVATSDPGDGNAGIGNAALAPRATRTTIDLDDTGPGFGLPPSPLTGTSG